MNSVYLCLKWLHIVSSAVLLGTGAGIAFFFFRANRTRDARIVASVARDVVLADAAFTATAVIVQPLTGVAMMAIAHYPVTLPWIGYSILLYVLVGCCWLPVVWLQIKMRDLAAAAATAGAALPLLYFNYYRRWFILGWPAFIGVLAIFWMMVTKWGG